MGYHIGRHWPAHYRADRSAPTMEDECPCPVEPCGLVDDTRRDPNCPQHGDLTKTMRSMHRAEDCPGAPDA